MRGNVFAKIVEADSAAARGALKARDLPVAKGALDIANLPCKPLLRASNGTRPNSELLSSRATVRARLGQRSRDRAVQRSAVNGKILQCRRARS